MPFCVYLVRFWYERTELSELNDFLHRWYTTIYTENITAFSKTRQINFGISNEKLLKTCLNLSERPYGTHQRAQKYAHTHFFLVEYTIEFILMEHNMSTNLIFYTSTTEINTYTNSKKKKENEKKKENKKMYQTSPNKCNGLFSKLYC